MSYRLIVHKHTPFLQLYIYIYIYIKKNKKNKKTNKLNKNQGGKYIFENNPR